MSEVKSAPARRVKKSEVALGRGAELLAKAMPLLDLTPEERTTLRRILERSGRLPSMKKRSESPDPTKLVQGQETSSMPGKKKARGRNKASTPELRVLERARAEKLKAQRKVTHRKSGFTDFLQQMPGSFESGKK